MSLPRQHLRRLTYALRDPVRASAAASALAGVDDPAAHEGLFDLLLAPPDEATGIAAVRALADGRHPLAREALMQAVLTAATSVRHTALAVLGSHRDPDNASLFGQVLARDPSVRLRRDALRSLAKLPAEARWPILTAMSDPVWRVRNDAVRILLAWLREDPSLLTQVRSHLATLGQHDTLTNGAVRYLEFLATPGADPPPRSMPSAPTEAELWRAAPWWDDDPPVLLENLRHLTEEEVRATAGLLPGLLTLQDGKPVWPYLEGIFHFVVAALERHGQPEHLAVALRLLGEPRRPFTSWVRQLLDRLTPQRHKELALVGHVPASPSLLPLLTIRQHDPDHHVRAAALTLCRAEALWRDPEQETSWRVLARAGELLGRSLEDIAPPGHQEFRAPERRPGREVDFPLGRRHAWQSPPVPPNGRALGRTGLTVAPLGLSGRYELPERGFREAIEAGVNLFFWEPAYRNQTRCWQHLVPSLKEQLIVVAGSFAADARSVRRDLEQALRALDVPRLGVFLLFWVRSLARLNEETLETLAEMRESGRVQAVGLSTHLRPLAVQAVRDGWDVVMVRHSLAHRAAETEVFPLAHQTGVGVLTFSNLCYGRLPQAPDAPKASRPRPTPAECYRYSLSQAGVSACLSAPRDLSQLRHNLQALHRPTLDANTQAALRPWGDAVYRSHRAFVEWLRSR